MKNYFDHMVIPDSCGEFMYKQGGDNILHCKISKQGRDYLEKAIVSAACKIGGQIGRLMTQLVISKVGVWSEMLYVQRHAVCESDQIDARPVIAIGTKGQSV